MTVNNLPVRAWKVTWRRKHRAHDRDIYYCNAYDEQHARERCRVYVERQYHVRKPIFINVSEFK